MHFTGLLWCHFEVYDIAKSYRTTGSLSDEEVGYFLNASGFNQNVLMLLRVDFQVLTEKVALKKVLKGLALVRMFQCRLL